MAPAFISLALRPASFSTKPAVSAACNVCAQASKSDVAPQTSRDTNSFEASKPTFDVSRRNMMAGLVAATAAGLMPNIARAAEDPALVPDNKYIEKVKEALEKFPIIEKAIKEEKWAQVEEEAQEIAKVTKQLNIITGDIFRAKEREAEQLVKKYREALRKLEMTENKSMALEDLKLAKDDLLTFLKVGGIEFADEDAYEAFELGSTPKVK